MKVGELEPIFGRTHGNDNNDEARYVVILTNPGWKPYTVVISEKNECETCKQGYKIKLTEALLLQILILFPPLNLDIDNVLERYEKLVCFLKRVAE